MIVPLVGTDFQTNMGNAGIVQGRDQVGYKLQNRFTFMSSSEHYQVMRLEFAENVLFRIIMDFILSGPYRATSECESGKKNDDKDYTVDHVPVHGRLHEMGI